jgi:hypothetical protein
MTLAVVFLTPLRIRQWVPTPLLALLIVTPLSLVLFNDNRLLELGLEPIARIGAIPEGGLQLVFPDFSQHLPELVKAGMVLALLGAIDSLLTSLVADNITQTNHDSNRELIGQGHRQHSGRVSLRPSRCRSHDANGDQHQIRWSDALVGHDPFPGAAARAAGGRPPCGTDPHGAAGGNPDQSRPRHHRLGLSAPRPSPVSENSRTDVRRAVDDGVLGPDLGRFGRDVRGQPVDR